MWEVLLLIVMLAVAATAATFVVLDQAERRADRAALDTVLALAATVADADDAAAWDGSIEEVADLTDVDDDDAALLEVATCAAGDDFAIAARHDDGAVPAVFDSAVGHVRPHDNDAEPALSCDPFAGDEADDEADDEGEDDEDV